MSDQPQPPVNPNEESGDEDGQLVFKFPEPERKIDLGNLVPKGIPIKLHRKQKGHALKADGAIPDPAEPVDLINEQVLETVTIKFKRDADLDIESANVTFTYAVRQTWLANSDAGRVAMGLDD
jgi:hypothetical protein